MKKANADARVRNDVLSSETNGATRGGVVVPGRPCVVSSVLVEHIRHCTIVCKKSIDYSDILLMLLSRFAWLSSYCLQSARLARLSHMLVSNRPP